jgi:hypothetical protein
MFSCAGPAFRRPVGNLWEREQNLNELQGLMISRDKAKHQLQTKYNNLGVQNLFWTSGGLFIIKDNGSADR